MAARNEAKIRFSAETKDFDKGIKDANSTLTTLRNELKLNEAQMRNNGVSIDGLKDKQQNLAAQMDAAQDKTKALSDKLAVAVEVFGENSTEANKLRNQLINAQTAEVKLQGAIDRCNAELDRQEEAANRVKTESEKLSDTISDQQSELDKLKRAYADYVVSGDEASDEAKELARKIGDLSGELKDNKKQMDDAAKAADELDRSLDDVDPDTEGFTVLKGALADLVSEGIQLVISAFGDLFSYFGQLPQQTMEIRQDMGTLITAFDNVGFSTEVATDTWKELYKVFGEDDRAVETANNIARMASSQEELNDWVTITTGVWATYQDSLPVEGLAESAAETAKTGEVTGSLADALNWSSEASIMFADYMGGDVVTAADAFNVALSECTTEEERQALITDTLTALYGDAAETYRDTTSAQMEAKEAAAEQILIENELATAIEPVTTAWTEMKNELLAGILPVVESVSGVMTDALTWMKEHPVAMQAIAAAVGVLAIGLGGLAIAVGVYTAAQWAMNSAILANPITWIVVAIVAAIAALVAIGVVLYNNWDTIKAKAGEVWAGVTAKFSALWESVKEVWNGIWESITAVWNGITSGISSALETVSTTVSSAFDSVKNTASDIWDGIKTTISGAWDGIVSGVSSAIDSVKSTVSSVWNSIKSTTSSVWNAIKSAITTPVDDALTTVKGVIEKIKSAFDFSLKLDLKLPKISVSGGEAPYGIGGKGKLPSFSITWFKDGGIMMNPTVFGIAGNQLLAGGEAGPEAILPIDRLQGYISSAIDKTMQTVNINALVAAVEDLASRPVELHVNGRKFAVATAADTDSVNGNRLALSKRGLAL